ncbi:hypothetical protein E4U41_001613, partial [Claviceps citrina]
MSLLHPFSVQNRPASSAASTASTGTGTGTGTSTSTSVSVSNGGRDRDGRDCVATTTGGGGYAPGGSSTEAGAAAGHVPGHGPVPVPAGAGVGATVHGPPARDDRDRLIVGVDFGTTFSGVAAVYTATPDDVDIIKSWPGGNGITSDKVPTEIAYDVPPAAADAAPVPKWGFQFRPEDPRLRCIKLFLDHPAQKLPFYVSHMDTAAQLRRSGKNVVDAVADYLTQLHRHTLDTLTRRYGDSFMASTPVDFVLTCPAVWSDAAKNRTLLAAERAGMGGRSDVQMVSEPEAAAVYTLKAIQGNHFSVGDNFV